MKNLRAVPPTHVMSIKKVRMNMNSDLLEKEILLEHNRNLSANVSILKNIIRDKDLTSKPTQEKNEHRSVRFFTKLTSSLTRKRDNSEKQDNGDTV